VEEIKLKEHKVGSYIRRGWWWRWRRRRTRIKCAKRIKSIMGNSICFHLYSRENDDAKPEVERKEHEFQKHH